ncbi:hypothetical protein EDD86DRAFT_208815 [Gorgonomyces haynaldii]|nr:hypothetical protein EDD86DRAFT_208815 [Gorgonomyces haynaldii]
MEWNRGQKYECDACRIFLHENQRRNHERSQLHQRNVQHKLRNLIKKNETEQREKMREQKLVHDIEIKALGKYAKDTGNRASAVKERKQIQKSRVNIANYGLGGQQNDYSDLPSAPVWEPPAHLEPQSNDPLGPWTAVEPPTQSMTPVEKVKPKVESVEYEEDEPVQEFVIQEKQLPVQPPTTDEEPVFKKRKIQSQSRRKK